MNRILSSDLGNGRRLINVGQTFVAIAITVFLAPATGFAWRGQGGIFTFGDEPAALPSPPPIEVGYSRTASHGESTEEADKGMSIGRISATQLESLLSKLQQAVVQQAALVSSTQANVDSVLTIGTLFGATYALANPKTYKIRSGVVVDDRVGNASDRFQPVALVFPSLGIYAGKGMTLAAIVPAGLTGGGDAAVGLGLSFSKAVSKGAQVGLALAVVWVQVTSLDRDQEISYVNGTSLPSDASTTIGTTRKPILSIGVFMTPLF